MYTYERKRAAYDHICGVHDAYTATLGLACHKGCAACCTINVTATSLEACAIADHLDRREDGSRLWDRLAAARGRKRFAPGLTFNRMAESYRSGEPLPVEESPDPSWGPCPLLTEDRCPVYEVRPFSCRCLVSTRPCQGEGAALMTPLTVTVNTVMHQYIEHVDHAGMSGNLTDLLLYMRPPENRDAYKMQERRELTKGFLPNAPATVLLAGPEDKERLASILYDLNRFQ